MPQSIDQALVTQFSDMVHVEADQLKTRTRDKVTIIPVKGHDFTHNNFRAGSAKEITTRFAKRTPANSTHTVRWGTMRCFEWVEYLADYDDLQTLIDPQSTYARAAARELYKQLDRLVIGAMEATVVTGRNKDGTLTAAADGVITHAHGGVGYTFNKVNTVLETFTDNEVGVDMPVDMYTMVTGRQESDFRKEAELTSKDYNTKVFLENGRIKNVLDLEVIKFGGRVANPMLPKTSTTRKCYAFTKDAIKLGINKDITLEIDRRTDMEASPWQVTARMYMGAVRTEGVQVQVVECTETA